jgi:hypothetical protein
MALQPSAADGIMSLTFTNRGGHTNPQVQSYLHIFILSTDKAVRAYNSGRSLMFKYIASNNSTQLLFEALGEFETCITTVKRALALAERMASHSENPEIGRTQRRLLESDQRAVRPIRDLIEHMDGDLAAGEVETGQPQMLFISKDGEHLEIGSHRLAFTSLADVVRRLHGLSLALASRDRTPADSAV